MRNPERTGRDHNAIGLLMLVADEADEAAEEDAP